MCNRATLDLNLRHISEEIVSLREKHARKLREKDIELRRLKKADQLLRVARDGLQQVEKLHESRKADVSTD